MSAQRVGALPRMLGWLADPLGSQARAWRREVTGQAAQARRRREAARIAALVASLPSEHERERYRLAFLMVGLNFDE